MGEFSLTHILLIGIIALIFFGPSRLPQLGQGLGKAIRGFKQGLNEIDVDPKDIKDDHKQVSHQHQAEQQTAAQTQKQGEKQNS